MEKALLAEIYPRWMGSVPYEEGLQIQKWSQEKIRGTKNQILIGLEHPLVITLGRRAKPEEDVLSFGPSTHLGSENRPIPIYKTDRGGFATLHSPGQLVIYPILDLGRNNIGVREYIHRLLEVTWEMLTGIGISSWVDISDPGVYTARGKIASCGVHVSRGLTGHGVAINVMNDLREFQRIRPCGLARRSMDRVADFAGDDAQRAESLRDCESLFLLWQTTWRNKFLP